MTKLFSIGAGNEDLNSFVNRLKKWDITCLVDLRSYPYSEYVPHFNRESLSASLKNAGIDYLYFGDKLGGRPPEGFEKFRASPRFKENIDLLLSQIEGKVTALMCSEFDILKCHRRFIVVEIMINKGIEVDIIDKEGNIGKHLVISTKKSKLRRIVVDPKGQSELTGFYEGDESNE